MSSNGILITRPEHDPGTRYLSYWGQEIINQASKKGLDVFDLRKDKANKKEFEGRMKKLKPSFVLLNGHGDEDCVAGHDNEILVKKGENEELLKNKITYAVSCDSAKELGQSCVDEKTAYIGYDEKFILTLDRNYLNNPLKDKRAARFLDASNQVAKSLIKGHTAEESAERSKKMFKKAIISLLFSSDPDARADAKDLFWDMRHQVCLGNKNAKI